MGFSLGMVMNVTVLGACAVSFAMKMLKRDPLKTEKKETLDKDASFGEYEELANGLSEELKESNTSVEEIKAFLMDKETKLQIIKEENKNLRSKILLGSEKIAGLEDSLVKMQNQLKEAYAKIEVANVREKETFEELRLLKLELQDSKERASNTLEQLEAFKAGQMAMEIEMKKNRIQTEQWKKAADDAAQNGERYPSPDRKRHGMLRKLGILFKKKSCV